MAALDYSVLYFLHLCGPQFSIWFNRKATISHYCLRNLSNFKNSNGKQKTVSFPSYRRSFHFLEMLFCARAQCDTIPGAILRLMMQRILCVAKVPIIIYGMVHFLPILMNTHTHTHCRQPTQQTSKRNSIWCVTCVANSLLLLRVFFFLDSVLAQSKPHISPHKFQFSSVLSLLFYSFLFAHNHFQHAVKWCHLRWPPSCSLPFRSICLVLLATRIARTYVLVFCIRTFALSITSVFFADSKPLHLLS